VAAQTHTMQRRGIAGRKHKTAFRLQPQADREAERVDRLTNPDKYRAK
jgi:hypothetical protein